MAFSASSDSTAAVREPAANALVTELKTRARLRLNAERRAPAAADAGAEPKLRACLAAVARDVGFAHWEQARQVLGGLARPGDDLGTFWHAPRTGVLLNVWFARAEQAHAALAQQPAGYLLPYRRQYVLVQADFISELGVDPQHAAWQAVGRDLVRGYGSDAWLALARQRLAAPRSSFA